MNPQKNTASFFLNSIVERESGSFSSDADTQISDEENCQSPMKKKRFFKRS